MNGEVSENPEAALPIAAALPVLISFGSNIRPRFNLLHGLQRLHERVGLQAVSTVYRSAALPDLDGPDAGTQAGPEADFLNGVVRVRGGMEPLSLKQALREVEEAQNRERTDRRYAPRTLDLDIALMGERVIQWERLMVPDPDIVHRPFLAIPLAELAPDLWHPVEQASLATIAARFGPKPPGLTVDRHTTAILKALVP